MEQIHKKHRLSNKIMSYIAYLDLFSSKTTFKFRNKDYYSTTFGGILSLLFIIVCLIFTIANQSLWQNNFIYTENDQSYQSNPYNLQTSDLNLGITFLNYQSAVIFNNIQLSFSYFDYAKSTYNLLKSKKNCGNSQFCIISDQLCPFYFHQNYNYDQLSIIISGCNIQINPTCKISDFYNTFFGVTFSIKISYKQWIPDLLNKNLKSIQGSQIISLKLSDNITNYIMPFNKINFFQKYSVIPSLIQYNYANNKLFYDSSNKIIAFSALKSSLSRTLANITIIPQGKIININYSAADYTQIIIYFASFVGTFIFIFSCFMPNYVSNMLYWEVGNLLKYNVDKNNNIIASDSKPFFTFLVCLFYYKPLSFIWQSIAQNCGLDFLKDRMPLIKLGDKALNITNFLNKLIKLSKDDNLTKQKVLLDFDLKQQQQYDMEKQYEKIQEFIRQENGIEETQKKAFLKLSKINNFSLDQSKQIYSKIFPAKYKIFQYQNTEVFTLLKQFQYLLQLEDKVNQGKKNQAKYNQNTPDHKQQSKIQKNSMELTSKRQLSKQIKSIQSLNYINLQENSTIVGALSRKQTNGSQQNLDQFPIKKVQKSKFSKINKRLVKKDLNQSRTSQFQNIVQI